VNETLQALRCPTQSFVGLSLRRVALGSAKRSLLLAVLAVSMAGALGGCEFAPEPPPRAEDTPSPLIVPLKAQNAEAAKLYRVVESYFDEYLALNPIEATELGDHRFDDRFGDYASASWMANSLGIEQESLEKLADVDRKQLSGEDLITYEAFKQQRELEIGGYRYPSELLAINQFCNWPGVFAQLASGKGAHPFRNTRDYDNFLARMDGFAAWTSRRSTTCARRQQGRRAAEGRGRAHAAAARGVCEDRESA